MSFKRIFHINILICIGILTFLYLDRYFKLNIYYDHLSRHIYIDHDSEDWWYKAVLSILLLIVLVLKYLKKDIPTLKRSTNLSNLYSFIIGIIIIFYNILLLGEPYVAILSLFYLFIFDSLLNPSKREFSYNKYIFIIQIILFCLGFPVVRQSSYYTNPELNIEPPLPGEFDIGNLPTIVPMSFGLPKLFYSISWSYDSMYFDESYKYVFRGFPPLLLFKSTMFSISILSVITGLFLITWNSIYLLKIRKMLIK